MSLMSLISDSARRMGLTPEQYAGRSEMLTAQEDAMRKKAMDPNASKSMSEKEKEDAMNAWSNRRFLELGISRVPGEGEVYLPRGTRARKNDEKI